MHDSIEIRPQETNVVGTKKKVTLGYGVIFGLLSLTYGTRSSAAPNEVSEPRLRFDAEQNVCRPLEQFFKKVHREKPNVLYLGDVRSELFSVPGVSSPAWVDTSDPRTDAFYDRVEHSTPLDAVRAFREDHTGDWSGDALIHAGRDRAGRERLLLLHQDSIGMHGDYQTTISLLAPNISFSNSSIPLDPSRMDRNSVELMISLVPDSASARPAFPTDAHPDNVAKLLVEWLEGPLPQEPVSIENKTYVIAGNPLNGNALVYRIDADADAKIVCVTAPDRTVEAVKKFSANRSIWSK